MGQKVHPNGIRLGIVKPWNSTWFANTKEFADNLDSDFKVRQYLTIVTTIFRILGVLLLT